MEYCSGPCFKIWYSSVNDNDIVDLKLILNSEVWEYEGDLPYTIDNSNPNLPKYNITADDLDYDWLEIDNYLEICFDVEFAQDLSTIYNIEIQYKSDSETNYQSIFHSNFSELTLINFRDEWVDPILSVEVIDEFNEFEYNFVDELYVNDYNFHIEGEMTVDESCHFLNNGPIGDIIGRYRFLTLGANGSILVESGNTLIITERFINSCDELWESIIVEDGATLILWNCTIHGGIDAIKPESGAKVQIKNCLFENNATSIRITDTGMIHSDSYFFNNVFQGGDLDPHVPEGNDPQLPYIRSVYGIYIANQDFLAFNGLIENGENLFNEFYDFDIGVRIHSSDVMLNYATFENCGMLPKQAMDQNEDLFGAVYAHNLPWVAPNSLEMINSKSYIGNHVEDCPQGIYATNYSVFAKDIKMNSVGTGIRLGSSMKANINIIGNEIVAKDYGVNALNARYVKGTIKNNAISVNNDFNISEGIRVVTTIGNLKSGSWTIEDNYVNVDVAKTGIYVSGYGKTRVEDNTVELENEYTRARHGIAIDGGYSNKIRCNLVDGFSAGGEDVGLYGNSLFYSIVSCNDVDDTRFNIKFNDDNMIIFSANTMGDNHVGLLLGDYSASSDIVKIGQQFFRGNLWLDEKVNPPTEEEYNAVNIANSQQIKEDSKFIVYIDEDPITEEDIDELWPYPSEQNGDPNWFEEESEQTGYDVCPSSNCINGAGSEVYFDGNVISGDYTDLWGPELAYISQSQMLLDRLLENESYSDIHDSLYYMIDDMELLAEIEIDISEYLEVDDQSSLFLHWNGLDSLNTSSVSDWEEGDRAEIDSLMDNSLSSGAFEIPTSVITTMNADLNSISDSTVLNSSQYQFIDLILPYLKQDSAVIHSTFYKTDLENLASECTLITGRYGFQARNLYQALYDSIIVEDNSCIGIDPRKIDKSDPIFEISELHLQPNPAKNQIEIDNRIEISTKVIFDLTGKEIIISNNNSSLIDILSLPTGLYIIKVKDLDGKMYSGKFIKI